MRKHILSVLLLSALIFLSACGGTLSIALETTPTADPAQSATLQALESRVATLLPNNAGLDMQASSDAIRQALLGSHKNWKTLWMDGEIVTTSAQGGSERQRAQLWVDRAEARFRSLTGPLDGSPLTFQGSDGVTQSRTNLTNGAAQAQPLMEGVHNLDWQASPVPSDAAGIVPHPLDLEIDTPLSELAFPAALAQQGGSFTPAAMEKTAGRLALVVEYSFDAQLRARIWIDTKTGILLRWDSFGKDDPSKSPATSIIVHNLAVDPDFPAGLFDLQLKEKPSFALDVSGITNPTPLPPEAVFGKGEGELYFVIDRTPEDLQLARLPESCINGSASCPEPQGIEGFPNTNNTILPLIWSPDGRLAVLVQQGLLYRFDPDETAWRELAQFPILRESVVWSAGGEKLAFIGQDGDGRQDLYVVGADGEDLQNLTNGAYQGTDISIWVDGFLADGRLLFTVIDRTSAEPHALQTQAGVQAQPVQGLAMQHGTLTLSPDRQQAAFTNSQDGTTTLHVAGLDLSGDPVKVKGEARRLGTFQQASIQQILWSAAGEAAGSPGQNEQWIAFNVLTSSGPGDMVNTVYVIRPDGTDLRQLFQAASIQQLSFAANGRFLIATLPDGGQPSLIPLDGSPVHPLEAPGLRLDQRILGVSWRGK